MTDKQHLQVVHGMDVETSSSPTVRSTKFDADYRRETPRALGTNRWAVAVVVVNGRGVRRQRWGDLRCRGLLLCHPTVALFAPRSAG